jgi:hypothetical protein
VSFFGPDWLMLARLVTGAPRGRCHAGREDGELVEAVALGASC